MALARYTITTTSDLKRTYKDANGNLVLVFETDAYDEGDYETAESSADRQNDMLWEMLNHTFEAFDDEGNEIEYDSSGYRK